MRRPRRFAAIAAASALVVATLGAVTLTPMGAPIGTPLGIGTAAAAGLPSPKADIVVDAASGRVLIGDSIHKALHPASTAKIMTALAVVERLSPTAPITANAQDVAVETMRIGLPVNQAWPFDQMMASMLMVSANDAAYAFANTVGGGSLDKFAADLYATAKQLGLQDSTLGDPAGLDDTTSYKGGPYMSAFDLAIATRNALTVPEIAKWATTHRYSFTDPSGTHHDLVNHNKMLPGGGVDYPGAIGFKTGYTERAQHALVAVANRNGRTLIAVVLGASDAGYAEAASLLDAGFAEAAHSPGIGVTLPPVKVSRYSVRATDQASFAKLGTSANVVASPVITVPAVVPVLNKEPLAAVTTTTVPASAAAAHTPTHHSSGPFSLRNFAIVLILLLGVVVAFRRRAVKRQRAMRLARRRQRISAMRSGGLPVVDGRYRAGTRIGPPVESHVRVRPARRPPRADPA